MSVATAPTGGALDIIRTRMSLIRSIHGLIGAFVLTVVIAACGGGHPAARATVTQRATMPTEPRYESLGWRDRDPSATIVVATQLEVDDATWNEVIIHADGFGYVAQWLGETTPIHNYPFRLSAPDVTRVRRLVSRVPALARHPPTFSAQDKLVYTIRADRRAVRVPDAPGRTGLAPLVAIFDQLISSYS